MNSNRIYEELKSLDHNPHHLSRYINFLCYCSSLNSDRHDYFEMHHILPSSLFPQYKTLSQHPWNQIKLTAREHYIAHWMLAKAIGGKMWFAFQALNMHSSKNAGYYKNSHLYEKSKIYHSIEMKINNPRKGKTIAKFVDSEETITVDCDDERFQTGELVHFMKGVPKSKEHIENFRQSRIGKKRSLESRMKQSKSTKGKRKPEGFGDKVSESLSNREKSESHRQKLSESLYGYTIVMDDEGNTFKVSKGDPRFLSGELKSTRFSKKESIVNVYDANGELQYQCINENFERYRKRLNLPYGLIQSYKDGGSPILTTNDNATISRLKRTGMYQYKGWYAIRVA